MYETVSQWGRQVGLKELIRFKFYHALPSVIEQFFPFFWNIIFKELKWNSTGL